MGRRPLEGRWEAVGRRVEDGCKDGLWQGFIVVETSAGTDGVCSADARGSLGVPCVYPRQAWQGAQGLSCLKKSLPLSSTRMKAGKSSTVIFQMASMPNSGYSTHSIDLMELCESTAATPPMVPR